MPAHSEGSLLPQPHPQGSPDQGAFLVELPSRTSSNLKFAEPTVQRRVRSRALRFSAIGYFDSDPSVLRIFDPLGGTDPPPDLINVRRPLPDPLLGPTLAILGSTWPFQANLEANMASKLFPSSLQAHNKTSREPLCKLSEGSWPPQIGQQP